MLQGQPSAVHTSEADLQDGKKKESPAVVPLAIPMVSGPGAMATVIVTAGEAKSIVGHAVLLGVILVNVLVCYVMFRLAARSSPRCIRDEHHRPRHGADPRRHRRGHDGERSARRIPDPARRNLSPTQRGRLDGWNRQPRCAASGDDDEVGVGNVGAEQGKQPARHFGCLQDAGFYQLG